MLSFVNKRLAFHFYFIFSTHLINSFIFLGFEWDRGGDLDHIEANYQPDIASRLPNSPTRRAAIFAGQQLTQKRFILVGGYTLKGARNFFSSNALFFVNLTFHEQCMWIIS